MEWEEILEELEKRVKVGTEVPKTDGNTRVVTKILANRIYMRTGVKTQAHKYITEELIKYAYNIIVSGGTFDSKGLRKAFPNEYNQGGCVFSMTGGVLEILGIAKYIERIGYISI